MRYDAIVIGSGAAGVYFSLAAANKGKKIAIVEREKLGGTAFATGCLPVKKFMDKIKSFEKAKELEKDGLLTLNHDMDALFKSAKSSIANIESHIEKRLKDRKVDIYIGDAIMLEGKKVMVGGETMEADHIVIATGTRASSLPGSEIDQKTILSHSGVFESEELPKEIAILGGNVEGIEFASLFSELGVNVTVIEREGQILSGNDPDLIANIEKRLVEKGVKIMLESEVSSIENSDQNVTVKLSNGSEIKTPKLVVTGIRRSNIPSGLEKLHIELQNNFIKVNKNLMTSQEGIYAIGDINGLHGMAHIAIQQGILLADHIWDKKEISFDYDSLPRCIFTLNELAGAGWQESSNEGLQVKRIELKDTFRGLDNSFDGGFIKLVLKDGVVKGLWINSIDGGSLIGNIGLWIDREIDIDEIKRSLFINPTISEGLMDAII